MLNNPLLDFAIGMIAFFLVAALLTTALQEGVAQLLDTRAKTLRAAIGNILDGEAGGGELAEKFFAHPLIAGLNTRSAGIGPSYVPRDLFVKAIRDLKSLTQAGQAVVDATKQLNDEGVNKVLKSLAANAANAGETFDKALGDWFDACMERVSGLYKRKAQTLAFWLGLFVAAAGNLDAVAVGTYLASNREARSAFAEGAAGIATADPQPDPAKPEDRKKLQADLTDLARKHGVPIGWSLSPRADGKPHTIGDRAQLVLHRSFFEGALLGWLVTALAGMLGAAFWFDLLARFVNIRATGPKPKKQDEGAAA